MAATAWANEPEVAAATRRWVKEQEKIVAKLHDGEARRAARRDAEAVKELRGTGSACEGSDRQAAAAEQGAGAPLTAPTNAAAEDVAAALADAGPSAEDWERLSAEVLRRELSPSDDGKSVRVADLDRREKAVLTHKKFEGQFLRRLSAAVEEIDRALKLVLGDLDDGRIRFTTDGVDLTRLTPEEAALVERHRHRMRIEDALDSVRKRRNEDEEREYQELVASDALYRAGKGPGR